MNITITGHHVEVTPALRQHTMEKLSKLSRHFDMLIDMRVILAVDKSKAKDLSQRAECTIHVKGADIFAESSTKDLYASVDSMVDKLDRQVLKHKERKQMHQSVGFSMESSA